MLAEFLFHTAPARSWVTVIPGVRICRLAADSQTAQSLPLQHTPGNLEVLFCQSGCLELSQQDFLLRVSGRDILLLSDVRSLTSAWITQPLEGVLISVDGHAASAPLDALRSVLGIQDCSTARLRTQLEQCQGCQLIHALPWSQCTFSELDAVPPEKQSTYCLLKSLELLYLLNNSPVFSSASLPGGYISKAVEDTRRYMQAHLDEKLTIAAMSKQFHISPTALKTGFRQLYRMPIHQWLQIQRMNRAAELLRQPPVSVLQAAQAVGYEGLSQFGIMFKRQFGVTPGQYKKMSNSIKI